MMNCSLKWELSPIDLASEFHGNFSSKNTFQEFRENPMGIAPRNFQVFTYVGFRVGGLGYGPRFRCLQPTHGLMVEARGKIIRPEWGNPRSKYGALWLGKMMENPTQLVCNPFGIQLRYIKMR